MCRTDYTSDAFQRLSRKAVENYSQNLKRRILRKSRLNYRRSISILSSEFGE